MNVCHKRLQKEFISLKQQPVDNIEAVPNDRNILEWHYVVVGPKDSVYEGGVYHGKLLFSEDYPYKPPAILMITRSGRFKTNTRLCLSMSDFHPETWNPLWSVGSILSGLLSFMLETKPTLGSIETSNKKKRELAKLSMEENIRNEQFRRFFPELVAEYKKKKETGAVEADTDSAQESVLSDEQAEKRNAANVERQRIAHSSAISCRTVVAALIILVLAVLLPFKL